MRHFRAQSVLVLIALASCSLMLAGQQPAAGRYTAAQAAAGRTTYLAQCAACHLPDLKGSGDAAPLAGSEFMDAWGRRSTQRAAVVHAVDHAAAAARRTERRRIRQHRGVHPPVQRRAGRESAVDGGVRRDDQRRGDRSGAGGSGGGRRRGRPPGRGAAPAPAARGQPAAGEERRRRAAAITVAGEVKNYVPVTDAMLRNPSPNDWLMIRRDYHASNYSPLNQITRDNVKDLRLQWVWAMNEGGANQPAPLVHNGVVFLNNPGNIMQAIDGRTGDLIWENRYGTAANGAAMRGIAIYDDKVFTATSDARLVALDARTGKTVWQTTIGDRSKGNYSTSSGPLVAKGKLIQGLGGCSDLPGREMLHQRLRRRHRQGAVAVQHHRQAGRARRRLLGSAHESVPRRRRVVDHRQLRSGSESHLLGHGAGQALDADQPRHVGQRRCALHQLDAGARCRYRQARLALPARAGGIARPRRRLRAGAGRRRRSEPGVHGRARTASCGSSIGRPASTSATRKPCSRTSGNDSIRRPAGRPTGRTSWSSSFGEWVQGCPSTEGGHNWPASSYHAGTNAAHHPAQPELHRDQRAAGRAEGRRRQRRRRRPALLRDARIGRQHRQARRLRREDDEGDCGRTSSARRS